MVWHKISESKAALFSEGATMTEVEVGGKKICIALVKDRLMACAAKCPHAGGKMASGYIDTLGNIVCPIHRYKFSLENGRNVSGEGYFLKIYPLEEREGGIFIGIDEKKGLFGL